MNPRFAICLGIIQLVFVGLSRAEDIDPRTQCDKIMKGEKHSDKSWQPVYGPCCNDRAAMKSKKAMNQCIGEQGLKWMQKRGILVR